MTRPNDLQVLIAESCPYVTFATVVSNLDQIPEKLSNDRRKFFYGPQNTNVKPRGRPSPEIDEYGIDSF